MKIEIEIADGLAEEIDPGIIREAVAAVLEGSSREMSVRVGSEAEIQDLNRQFTGTDKATDVLAFPSGEPGDYLGDVFVCLPQARIQADRGGHSLKMEVQLLAVHGTLHLLGFDHGTHAEKSRMWEKQRQILESLGNTLSPP